MGTVDLLETFAEVLAGADEDESPEAFYGRLCEAVCRVAQMDGAVIFRYDEARRRVRAVGAHGLDVARFADAQVTVETAPIARESLERDAVMEAPGAAGVPAEYADLVAGIGVVVCAPMVAAGRWLGVILCGRADPLDDGERHVLWTLGKIAALATRARVATVVHQQARALQDRVDLAREVHDAVIQRLFGVSLALAAEAPLDAAAQRRAGEEVQEALAELRKLLARPIAPSPPSDLSLAEEAARLGVELAGDAAPPGGAAALAVSVLAEAVRNAHKHASPEAIDVRVEDVEGAWVMEVVNDGVAGRPAHAPGMGLRLAGLEALHVGGLLEFGPAGERRWRVRLTVPRD